MSSHESYPATGPHDEQPPESNTDNVIYLTNGHRLFQVDSHIENYGLAGGRFTILRDVVDENTYQVDDMHLLFLTQVTPKLPEAS